MKKKLILFTRYPIAGLAKTRLIPALGSNGAADLQQRMTEHTLHTAVTAASRSGLALEIHYAGGSLRQIADWLGRDHSYCEQGPGDLGDKMNRAFQDAFNNDFQQVIIIGADCPALTASILEDGFARLYENDLVLGPAMDGGYYLIGLCRPCHELFLNKPWGDSSLLSTTINLARKLDLESHLLEELADVDRPEDLANFGGHPDPE